MGIFSSRKETFVSSQVWNLSGSFEDRTNFLKTTIVGSILNSPNLSEGISASYLSGLGIKFRSYEKWCTKSGYKEFMQLKTPQLNFSNETLVTKIVSYVNTFVPEGTRFTIVEVEAGSGNMSWHIEKYLIDSVGFDALRSGYEVLDRDINDLTTVKVKLIADNTIITFPEPVTPSFLYNTFLYVRFKRDKDVLLKKITEEKDGVLSTSGYTLNPNGLTDLSVVTKLYETRLVTKFNKVTNEYSEVLTNPLTSTTNLLNKTWHYTKAKQYVASDPNTGKPVYDLIALVQFTNSVVTYTDLKPTVLISGNVTTTTYRSVPSVKSVSNYVKVISRYAEGIGDKDEIFIYPYGGSAELGQDAVFDSLILGSNKVSTMGDFVPPIPLVIDSKDAEGELLDRSKKAFKKATGKSYDVFLKQIKDSNDKIKDIDYIYSFFGVSLNTKNTHCAEYLYRFFGVLLADIKSFGTNNHSKFLAEWKAAEDSIIAYNTWYAKYNGRIDSDSNSVGNITTIPTPPVIKSYPKISKTTFTYEALPQFKITISWNNIEEKIGSGLAKAGAKPNQFWVEKGATTIKHTLEKNPTEDGQKNTYVDEPVFTSGAELTIDSFVIVWQVTKTSWKKIICNGLVHSNLVYGDKSINITSNDALDNEEESGFLVPLSSLVLKKAGLVAATQVALESHYLVFNSYTVVKTKWYQRGFFKVLMVVVSIVVSVYFGPAGGILGSNAIVGGSIASAAGITVSAATAAVLGSIANSLAAMILSSLIVEASSSMFGEKLGGIIGAIASVMAIGFLSSPTTGVDGLKNVFNEMMKADNLINLTSNIAEKYASGSMQEMVIESKEHMDSYNAQISNINKLYKENLSDGVTESLKRVVADAIKYERPEQFLARTLMTGSDIAAMTNSQISNFAAMTTNIQLR